MAMNLSAIQKLPTNNLTMNYLIIKSIIEATIANFHCKNCSSQISERDLNILGAAGNGLNLEIICPECKLQ